MTSEGALIAFTLLIQLTTGSALFYSFFFFTSKKDISKLKTGFDLKTPEFLLLLLTSISILISMLHLGNPKNAINALNNLSNSWISFEILSLSILSFNMFLIFLVRSYFKLNKRILPLLFVFLVLSCILLILVMINLYMIPTVITWSTWFTPASFILTTLILGIVGIITYTLFFKLEMNPFKGLDIILIILLTIETLVVILNLHMLNGLSIPNSNLFLLEGMHLNWIIFRVVMIIASILLIFAVRKKMLHENTLAKKLLILLVILLLLEQLAGRFLFFASYIRVGL